MLVYVHVSVCESVCVKPHVHFFESWNEVKGKAQGSESLASSRFFLEIFVVFFILWMLMYIQSTHYKLTVPQAIFYT